MRKREALEAVARLRAEVARLTEELERDRGELAVRDQILSAMDEAIILVADGVVAYANTAAARAFGAEAGKPVPEMLPRAPSGGGSAEVTIHHPERRDLRVTMLAAGASRTLIVARDVTATKRVERVRRDFVADASHELKTPIAGILATAETLTGAIEDDPPAARRFAENLAAEARRLSKLVGDLLSLARLEQEQEDEGVLLDLAEVVRRVAAEVAEEAGARGVSLALDASGPAVVVGHADDLAALVRNLTENAVRYTPAGGRVDVTLDADRAVRLRVRDTGIGIPSRDLPRIFERFYRVDRARSRETGGTGLGLSIVRHVAETHGGTVEAESELGQGSTFTVTLPIATG